MVERIGLLGDGGQEPIHCAQFSQRLVGSQVLLHLWWQCLPCLQHIFVRHRLAPIPFEVLPGQREQQALLSPQIFPSLSLTQRTPLTKHQPERLAEYRRLGEWLCQEICSKSI